MLISIAIWQSQFICTHCSLRLIDRTLSGATTPGQSGLGSNGNEGILHFPQISKAGALPSDSLMWYPGHSMEGLYPSAEMQLMYCTTSANWDELMQALVISEFVKFTYLGSSVESTEKDIETRLTKAWTAINRLSIIWKSDLTNKMKCSFFQAAVTSILLYGCTTWMLTKRLEKKLDGNYTRMLRAILNKSWRQHPTRHQLYGHLPPITKTIQVRWTRHAGHCWRSRDKLIRDLLLWTPTHGRAKAGRPAQTYIQQLCEDTGCCPEDLPRAMNDREEWQERIRDIRATSAIWWWWWWLVIK